MHSLSEQFPNSEVIEDEDGSLRIYAVTKTQQSSHENAQRVPSNNLLTQKSTSSFHGNKIKTTLATPRRELTNYRTDIDITGGQVLPSVSRFHQINPRMPVTDQINEMENAIRTDSEMQSTENIATIQAQHISNRTYTQRIPDSGTSKSTSSSQANPMKSPHAPLTKSLTQSDSLNKKTSGLTLPKPTTSSVRPTLKTRSDIQQTVRNRESQKILMAAATAREKKIDALRQKMDSYLTACNNKVLEKPQPRSPHAPFLAYLGTKLEVVPEDRIQTLEREILDLVFKYSPK